MDQLTGIILILLISGIACALLLAGAWRNRRIARRVYRLRRRDR